MRALNRKVVPGIVAVIGLLALATSPVSAGEPESVEGTITLDGRPIAIPEDQGAPCPGSAGVDVEFTDDEEDQAWTFASGDIKVPFELPANSGDWYQADISFPLATGDYWMTHLGPPATFHMDGALLASMTIVELDDDACEKLDVVCSLAAVLTLDSNQSNHVGTLPTPTTGNVTHIVASTENPSGMRPVAIGTCNVTIQAALVGQPLALDLTLNW